jgi:hypothetical protein
VEGGDRARGEEFEREIARRDRVEGIRHWPVEAQRLGRHGAVDRERCAGEGGSTERRFIEPLAAIGQTAAVAAEHFDIGQQMMAEGHRLGRLEMGKARHDRVGVLLGFGDQDALQLP